MPDHFVSVDIVCNGCGERARWCVRIDRAVPQRIRCSPTGGGGGPAPAGIHCGRCGRQCFGSVADLRLVVERELRGRMDTHIKVGAVVVSC